jgi:hypothetical protein
LYHSICIYITKQFSKADRPRCWSLVLKPLVIAMCDVSKVNELIGPNFNDYLSDSQYSKEARHLLDGDWPGDEALKMLSYILQQSIVVHNVVMPEGLTSEKDYICTFITNHEPPNRLADREPIQLLYTFARSTSSSSDHFGRNGHYQLLIPVQDIQQYASADKFVTSTFAYLTELNDFKRRYEVKEMMNESTSPLLIDSADDDDVDDDENDVSSNDHHVDHKSIDNTKTGIRQSFLLVSVHMLCTKPYFFGVSLVA